MMKTFNQAGRWIAQPELQKVGNFLLDTFEFLFVLVTFYLIG